MPNVTDAYSSVGDATIPVVFFYTDFTTFYLSRMFTIVIVPRVDSFNVDLGTPVGHLCQVDP